MEPLRRSKVTILPIDIIVCMLLVISYTLPTLWNSINIVHQVPDGHVGVYWFADVLQKTTSYPGTWLKLPVITYYQPVQVMLHTDLVKDIPCETKGGVMINFERIEVVNRLKEEYVYETILNYSVEYDRIWIHDKIRHEINQFCSVHTLEEVYNDMFGQIFETMKEALESDCTRYAPGIEIISVHVTKPTIPTSLRQIYEQMEEERIKVLLSIERQKVAEKEAETNAYINKMVTKQKLMEKNRLRMQDEISNAMYVAREKSLADAKYYQAIKEAEANMLMLTPKFLELKFIESISNTTKLFFRNKPNIVEGQNTLCDLIEAYKQWIGSNKSLGFLIHFKREFIQAGHDTDRK